MTNDRTCVLVVACACVQGMFLFCCVAQERQYDRRNIYYFIIIIFIIIIIIIISCHRFSFFPGTSPLEPVVNPTTQASSLSL
jgi:hypothetical protein